jgi:hypothetical protein
MLRQLNIRFWQKLALAILFSVGTITIGLEIARVTWAIKGGLIANNAFYGVLSACFAVLISCVPTYRSLWSTDRKTNSEKYANWNSSEGSGQADLESRKLTAPQSSHGSSSIRSKGEVNLLREYESGGMSCEFITVPGVTVLKP